MNGSKNKYKRNSKNPVQPSPMKSTDKIGKSQPNIAHYKTLGESTLYTNNGTINITNLHPNETDVTNRIGNISNHNISQNLTFIDSHNVDRANETINIANCDENEINAIIKKNAAIK